MVGAIANPGILSLLITAVATTLYTNHTVGGEAGWFFNSATNTPSTNYSNWATNQTFNLGDYLVFNTNGNQTVIQTYNKTIYRSCNFQDAPPDGFAVRCMGGKTTADSLTVVVAVAVPLTQKGPNYYYSNSYNGTVQCQKGMAFEIEVKHGLGLPSSLNQPPSPPYVSPPSPPDSQSQSQSQTLSNQQENLYDDG